MPYTSTAAAKSAGFKTMLDGAPLTLAQINHIAEMYDAIKAKGGADNPMAVAIANFKKEYTKSGNRWVKRNAEGESAGVVTLTDIASVTELPDAAQPIWNDTYQIVVKKLKLEGVDAATAKTRARRAAAEQVQRYWEYDEGKWKKKAK